VLRLKVEIKINNSKLETIFFTSIPVIFATISFALLDKFYTPDEYVYIRNAIDFIHNGYIVPFDFVPLREWSAFLTGRFMWQVTLAAFIEATFGQLPYFFVNLPFLIMLLATVYGLAKILLRNREKAFIVSLIIISNPLVIIFPNFVLNDFAIASLTFVSLYWFIKSFSNKVDLYNLSKSFIVIFIGLLYKFHLIVPMAIWILFFFAFLKNKLYKLSRGHRLLFLIMVLPVFAYELLLDISALFTYYVLHDLQLNDIFARYVFFSPLGMFINLFFKTPWTGRLWWEIPLSEKLFFLLSILSPDILTPLITAFTLLSPLVMRKNHGGKIFTSVSLLSLIIAFLGFLGYSGDWDIQRYGLPVILMLQLAGLTAFLSSLGEHFALYAATIIMQMLTYLDYIIYKDKGITFYLWITNYQNTLDNIFVLGITYSFSLLILIGCRLLVISPTTTLKRKVIHMVQTLILIIIFLSFIINNINLTLYDIRNNPMFQEHKMKCLAFRLETLNNKGSLIVTNAYALPIYLKGRWLVIPAPLESPDLKALLEMGVNIKIAISRDEIATWPAYKLGINDLLERTISDNTTILKGNLINLSTGCVIYDIKGKKLRNNYNSDVSIIRATLKPVITKNQTQIKLSMDIYSKTISNVTIILSSYYFSKLFHVSLQEGYNHFDYIFPLNIGFNLGRKTDILLISDKGELLARTLTSVMLLEGLAIFPLLFIYFTLLVFYAYFSRHENIYELL
jgi:hypothetical protein